MPLALMSTPAMPSQASTVSARWSKKVGKIFCVSNVLLIAAGYSLDRLSANAARKCSGTRMGLRVFKSIHTQRTRARASRTPSAARWMA